MHEERQGNQRNHETCKGIYAHRLGEPSKSRNPLILGVHGVLAVCQMPFLG
jgi:hypothetical protein